MNQTEAIKVNTAQFKKILAFVREGDFAHAGEEEAIDLVFQDIPKNENRRILDVGCGLGGTAHLVQSGRWGQVTGVDIIEDGISYAKKQYPDVEFLVDDILNPAEIKNRKFDLIYMFNVFYVLPDQTKAIQKITQLAKADSQLIIFDYVDRGGYDAHRPEKAYDILPAPIQLENLKSLLKENNWKVSKHIDLTEKYRKWYQTFVNKIASKKNEIIKITDEPTYRFVYHVYHAILNNIEQGSLGGCVLYCQR